MSNYCTNSINIKGIATDIIKCIEGMKGFRAIYSDENPEEKLRDIEEIYCFNATIPVPEEIKALGYRKYGYDWSYANWGTKWDDLYKAKEDLDSILKNATELINDEDGKILEYDFSFTTANNEPDGWYEKLVKKNPNLEITMFYEEGGNGIYGVYESDAGDSTYERTEYETESEYIYYADENKDIKKTVDVMIERYFYDYDDEDKSERLPFFIDDFKWYEYRESVACIIFDKLAAFDESEKSA